MIQRTTFSKNWKITLFFFVYLRDFMQQTMESTKHVLNLIFPIIKEVDPILHEFILKSEVGSYFALSWLITWYGHVVKDMKRTCRIYDFFLATHPSMPIYLAAEIVMYRREAILDTDCDMPSVHHVLTSLAKENNLPDEELIQNAVRVFIELPPSELLDQPDYENELKFYKSLIMAKSLEKNQIIEDIEKEIKTTGTMNHSYSENNLMSNTSNSDGSPNKSDTTSTSLRKRTKSKSKSEYIIDRRNQSIEKSQNRQLPYVSQTQQDILMSRSKLKWRKRLAYVVMSGLAGAVISFWVQQLL